MHAYACIHDFLLGTFTTYNLFSEVIDIASKFSVDTNTLERSR